MISLSVLIIDYAEKQNLPRSIKDQLIRASTSVGANFTEAQDASSKRDFINKIYIAKKEAAETKYWLTLAGRISKDGKAAELSEEVHRFVMLLQKIINSSKESNRK
jgi:four helix bundle protein